MTIATSVIRRILSVTTLPFLLSLLGALACYVVSGPSLNLFLGLLVLLIILAPILVMAEASGVARLAVLTALSLPVIGVGFYGFQQSDIYFREWWRTTAVILVFAFALAALSVALRQLRCPIIVSAALSVIVGLTWLTWPIWASRTWEGEESADRVLFLSAYHPGMLIDGQLAKTSGGWTSHTIAYHLTDLNQNVTYSPTRAVWKALVLYGVLGGIPFGVQLAGDWRRRQRSEQNPATAFPLTAEPL